MYKLNDYNVRLVRDKYLHTNGLAVVAYTDTGVCYTVITKCIPDFSLEDNDDVAFIDTNNNPGIEIFLVKNEIAIPLHFGLDCGMCSYPLYKFDLTKLECE